MSYTIKFTNGKTLAVIADQSIDQVSTSVTLVGKNVNNYGEYLNNNLVGLLENFANLIEPLSPVVGQTWFDTSENRLKVYSTGTFKPVGSPIISTSEPAGSARGDLWVDTTNNLLKWYDGTEWQSTTKQYSDLTGKEGWVVETIQDVYNNDYQVTSFYSEGVKWAVMSTSTISLNVGSGTEGAFTWFNTNTIRPGLIINPAIGAKFYGTATSAESVAGLNTGSFLLRNVNNQVTTGDLWFNTDEGIYVGTATNLRLYVTGTTKTSVIAGTVADQPLEIRYNSVSSGTNAVAMHVDSANNRLGFRTNNPQVDIDMSGNVHIRGNLTVMGTQVSLETSIIKVNDKNIELATGQTTATDAFVDGGGLILHGTTDHTFVFDDYSQAWKSSINYNVASGFGYQITDDVVIEADPLRAGYYQLGQLVTAAPGLTHLPVIPILTVTNIVLTGNTISTADFTDDLYLAPLTNRVSLDNATKIVDMPDPSDAQDGATKNYVDSEITLRTGGVLTTRKPYVFSLDVTDFVDLEDDILTWLELTLPVDGFGDPYYAQPDGSQCSVVCTRYIQNPVTEFLDLNFNTGTTTINYVQDIAYTATSTTTSYISTITTATVSFLKDDFSIAGSVTLTPTNPIIQRIVRVYKVISGAWTYVFSADNEYLTSSDSIYVANIDRAVKQNSITPSTSSLFSITLSSITGVKVGHKVLGGTISTGSTATTVTNILTATNSVQVYPALTGLMPVATTVTFAYLPGSFVFLNAKGPATLNTGANAVLFDKQTNLNTINGILAKGTTSSFASTTSVAVFVSSVSISSTGTSTNWRLSLS
jgi:hypothetical protein